MKRFLLSLCALLLLSSLFSSCYTDPVVKLTTIGAENENSLIPSVVFPWATPSGEQSSPKTPSAESFSKEQTPDPSETPVPVPTPAPLPTFSPIPSLDPAVAPVFQCDRAFIYDLQKNCFLFITDGDRTIYPASTTKLLTILYAVTLLPLDKEITPGNELEMVRPHSSLAYVQSHHRLTAEQLIEGMLLPSGNDAAHVLAAAGGWVLKPNAKDGKEAVAAFMEGMNNYAKRLGLTNSVFLNPDGYDTEGHYSSLEDMAIVARNAYACPVIRKYSSVERDDVVYASGHQMTWKNTNINLWKGTRYYSPYVNGLKTGSVNDEYYCLLSSAEIEGKAFIFGFFAEKNSDARFEDTLTAVEWVKKYGLS